MSLSNQYIDATISGFDGIEYSERENRKYFSEVDFLLLQGYNKTSGCMMGHGRRQTILAMQCDNNHSIMYLSLYNYPLYFIFA